MVGDVADSDHVPDSPVAKALERKIPARRVKKAPAARPRACVLRLLLGHDCRLKPAHLPPAGRSALHTRRLSIAQTSARKSIVLAKKWCVTVWSDAVAA